VPSNPIAVAALSPEEGEIKGEQGQENQEEVESGFISESEDDAAVRIDAASVLHEGDEEDSLYVAALLGDIHQLLQSATSTTTPTPMQPMQAALLTRFGAKLLFGENEIAELDELIEAWVGAVSLLRWHIDDDNLEPGIISSRGAAMADHDMLLEKLEAFLLVKGDEYSKDRTLVIDASVLEAVQNVDTVINFEDLPVVLAALPETEPEEDVSGDLLADHSAAGKAERDVETDDVNASNLVVVSVLPGEDESAKLPEAMQRDVIATVDVDEVGIELEGKAEHEGAVFSLAPSSGPLAIPAAQVETAALVFPAEEDRVEMTRREKIFSCLPCGRRRRRNVVGRRSGGRRWKLFRHPLPVVESAADAAEGVNQLPAASVLHQANVSAAFPLVPSTVSPAKDDVAGTEEERLITNAHAAPSVPAVESTTVVVLPAETEKDNGSKVE
jgi:hypothetical protein